MNAQNFTQKTLEAIQTAQSMAEENHNSYIMPEHLLYALIDQDGGLIPSLLGKMGVDCNSVLSELDTEIARLPKVGGDAQVYLSQEVSPSWIPPSPRCRRSATRERCISPRRATAPSAPPRRRQSRWATSICQSST